MKTFRQFILEFYKEASDSTVTHEGHGYKLNVLFKLTDKSEVVQFKVSELKWVIKYDKQEDDPERVEAADITKPLLVTKDGELLVVLDGLHRLEKAVRDKVASLPGVWVTPEMLAKAKV